MRRPRAVDGIFRTEQLSAAPPLSPCALAAWQAARRLLAAPAARQRGAAEARPGCVAKRPIQLITGQFNDRSAAEWLCVQYRWFHVMGLITRLIVPRDQMLRWLVLWRECMDLWRVWLYITSGSGTDVMNTRTQTMKVTFIPLKKMANLKDKTAYSQPQLRYIPT